MIDEGIMFMLNEDGVADVYDDTYDVTIHCASEEEQKKTIEALNRGMKCKWIPCSERLPEEDGEYLVWVRYEGREFTTTEEYEDGMWNYSGAYNFNDKVIAWMPLPEQYKGE